MVSIELGLSNVPLQMQLFRSAIVGSSHPSLSEACLQHQTTIIIYVTWFFVGSLFQYAIVRYLTIVSNVEHLSTSVDRERELVWNWQRAATPMNVLSSSARNSGDGPEKVCRADVLDFDIVEQIYTHVRHIKSALGWIRGPRKSRAVSHPFWVYIVGISTLDWGTSFGNFTIFMWRHLEKVFIIVDNVILCTMYMCDKRWMHRAHCHLAIVLFRCTQAMSSISADVHTCWHNKLV